LGDGGWEERRERGAEISCKWEGSRGGELAMREGMGRHLPCRVDDLSG